MISNQQVEGLMSASGNVLGPNGDKIGSVGTFYLDDQTNEPAWVTVNTGLFGTNETFVPLSEATVEGIDVLVPYSKEEVKNAPQIENDGAISAEEEVTLYRYYGFTYDDGTGESVSSDAGSDTLAETDTITGTEKGAASGLPGGADDTGAGNAGAGEQEAGEARLRKYTVTETVTTEGPVSREEVRVERETVSGDVQEEKARDDADVDEAARRNLAQGADEDQGGPGTGGPR